MKTIGQVAFVSLCCASCFLFTIFVQDNFIDKIYWQANNYDHQEGPVNHSLTTTPTGSGSEHDERLVAAAMEQFRPFEPSFVLSNEMIDKFSEIGRTDDGDGSIASVMERNSSLLLNLSNITYPIEPTRGFECQAHEKRKKKNGTEEMKFGGGAGGRLRRTLVIMVNSKWSNFRRRKLQRSSWLNERRLSKQVCNHPAAREASIERVEYLFAIGQPESDNNQVDSKELERNRQLLRDELSNHNDLLMISLHENYRSMSIKHLSLFKWFLSNHQDAVWKGALVLKCDDDAQIELDQLLDAYLENELHKLSEKNNNHQQSDNWIMCAQFPHNTRVLRATNRKWRLTRREFPYDTYPAYCSGLAYFAPQHLLRRLLILAHLQQRREPPSEQPLWVDDVYITGILAASLESTLKVVRLNAHFCYTRARQAKRAKLNAPCMVSEIY